MNPEESIFYVYVYLDSRKPGNYQYGEHRFDYEPFYVGKGCNGRDREHMYESQCNGYLKNKIKKIQRETGDRPIIIREEINLLNEDACGHESNMIKTIGRKDLGTGPLLNLTDGGEGVPGRVASEITRKKMRDVNLGKKASDETKRQMSLAQKGVPKAEKTKQKMKEAARRRARPSDELKRKLSVSHSTIIWNIVSPEGQIYTIRNLKSFCKDNGLNQGHMCQVARGRSGYKQHKGWRCSYNEY